jgi:hypothetical protein
MTTRYGVKGWRWFTILIPFFDGTAGRVELAPLRLRALSGHYILLGYYAVHGF